ncbi:hypothetical protein ACSV5M_01320 [Cellvibrio sp. ARAG 10.3]|uniref:hypothetical protein n=1 Tax=Cellvibrio sp. ARAG 10.3 TaxID=3451358 RepID=UPI003F4793F3
MSESQGAMSIAEGNLDYKTDVNLVLDGGQKIKKYVLRTTLDSIGVWKAKYPKNASPFTEMISGVTKDAAIIDKEVWVFGIDASNSGDIFIAVSIAKKYFKISAKELIGEVYVKNLNAERENEMELQALVRANKALYSKVCKALVEAARKLGVSGNVNFWIFSNSINPKIPKQDLHEALKSGNAESITTDDKTKHVFFVGSNDGTDERKFKTNLHLAKLKI